MEKFFNERKETTIKFIAAYEISKRMRKVKVYDEEADYSTPIDHEISRPDPYDQNLEPGQIRVLPGTERITYIALIRRWGRGAYLIAPFSNYRFPATESEFLTEYNGGVWQRVLQGWNARIMQNETLQKSWIAGELPPQDLKDAVISIQLNFLSTEEVKIPERLLRKIGLPLSWQFQPDPRLDYIEKEGNNITTGTPVGYKDLPKLK